MRYIGTMYIPQSESDSGAMNLILLLLMPLQPGLGSTSSASWLANGTGSWLPPCFDSWLAPCSGSWLAPCSDSWLASSSGGWLAPSSCWLELDGLRRLLLLLRLRLLGSGSDLPSTDSGARHFLINVMEFRQKIT